MARVGSWPPPPAALVGLAELGRVATSGGRARREDLSVGAAVPLAPERFVGMFASLVWSEEFFRSSCWNMLRVFCDRAWD